MDPVLTILLAVTGSIVGAAGLGVAIWSALEARKANETSKKAAGHAAMANTIAQGASDLAHEIDDRSRERHDVRWVPQWGAELTEWRLYNHGLDTAHDVTLLITADDGNEIIETAVAVERGGHLVSETPGSHQAYLVLRQRLALGGAEELAQRWEHPQFRVFWRSELGVAHAHSPAG